MSEESVFARYAEETNRSIQRLTDVVERVADSVASLAKAQAVAEERHSNFQDALKRLGDHVDDLEKRMRWLERVGVENGFIAKTNWKFTWAAAALMATLVMGYLFSKVFH